MLHHRELLQLRFRLALAAQLHQEQIPRRPGGAIQFQTGVRGPSCHESRKSRRASESNCVRYLKPFLTANCSRCFSINLCFFSIDSLSFRSNSASSKKHAFASATVIGC